MVRSGWSKVWLTAWMARTAVFLVAAFAGRRGNGTGSCRGGRSGSRFNHGCSFLRKVAVLSSLLVLLLCAPGLRAQKNDWHKVEQLEPGSWLHVKARRKYFCVLEGVAHDELICEVHLRRSFATATIAIPRSEVREVRKLPNLDDQHRDGWIGAGLGATAGAILAGTGARAYRGANAVVGGLGGGAAGYFGGALVVLFQMHGKLIYKR